MANAISSDRESVERDPERRGVTRRALITGLAASAVAPAFAAEGPEGVDPNRIVFFADPHISGKWSVHHQKKFLARFVGEVLALKPRPANLVVLGDLANGLGFVEDYRDFAKIVAPIEKAGIRLTLGMGNHDKRRNFLEVYPRYAETTKVPGRIVSEVNTPNADFILLDTLWEAEKLEEGNHVDGQLDAAQRAWLEKRLAAATKPTFVGAHHHLYESGVGLRKLLVQSPKVHGYIYGHEHEWYTSTAHDGSYHNRQTIRTVCMPSAGHFGDIGYCIFDIGPESATMSLRQADHFFNYDPPPDKRQKGWDAIVAENQGRKMTFYYDKPAAFQDSRPWMQGK